MAHRLANQAPAGDVVVGADPKGSRLPESAEKVVERDASEVGLEGEEPVSRRASTLAPDLTRADVARSSSALEVQEPERRDDVVTVLLVEVT